MYRDRFHDPSHVSFCRLFGSSSKSMYTSLHVRVLRRVKMTVSLPGNDVLTPRGLSNNLYLRVWGGLWTI